MHQRWERFEILAGHYAQISPRYVYLLKGWILCLRADLVYPHQRIRGDVQPGQIWYVLRGQRDSRYLVEFVGSQLDLSKKVRPGEEVCGQGGQVIVAQIDGYETGQVDARETGKGHDVIGA